MLEIELRALTCKEGGSEMGEVCNRHFLIPVPSAKPPPPTTKISASLVSLSLGWGGGGGGGKQGCCLIRGMENHSNHGNWLKLKITEIYGESWKPPKFRRSLLPLLLLFGWCMYSYHCCQGSGNRRLDLLCVLVCPFYPPTSHSLTSSCTECHGLRQVGASQQIACW